jgi:hypothetical protein
LYHESPNPKIDNIAEIGPASSFGVGLMALLSGARSYSALEIRDYKVVDKNLRIFEELIQLFKDREKIPDENEFPQINIRLDSYDFPVYIFDDKKLEQLLQPERLMKIRQAISSIDDDNARIKYLVPWNKSLEFIESSFDLIFSRAVMEHVSNYSEVYQDLYFSLKAQGRMIHDIEYHSHNLSKIWNGHWCYSSFLWSMIVGNRKYLLNRSSHTMHIETMKSHGMIIIREARVIKESKIDRKLLPKKFKAISDKDISSYGGFILAAKK